MEKNTTVLNKLIAIIFLFGVFTACNNDETARIKINIPDYGNKKVVIEEQRVAGKKFVDSVYFSSKGKLAYKFNVKQPIFYNLRINGSKDLFLLLSPDEKVSITQEENVYKIEGSEESQKLNYLYDSLFATREILNGLRQEYSMSIDEEYRDSLSKEYLRVTKKYHKFTIKFILDNLSSLTSIAALYQELSSEELVFSQSKRFTIL